MSITRGLELIGMKKVSEIVAYTLKANYEVCGSTFAIEP